MSEKQVAEESIFQISEDGTHGQLLNFKFLTLNYSKKRGKIIEDFRSSHPPNRPSEEWLDIGQIGCNGHSCNCPKTHWRRVLNIKELMQSKVNSKRCKSLYPKSRLAKNRWRYNQPRQKGNVYLLYHQHNLNEKGGIIIWKNWKC